MRIENPKIVAALPGLDVELRPRVSLAELTSLGIGGTTDLLRIKKHESIPDLLTLLDANGVAHKFLGGGSNLLVGDGELPWVALQLARPVPDVVLEGNLAQVDAAADLGRTVTFCAKHDLGGMEGLIGVPGTVGGALRMNAGALVRHDVRVVRQYAPVPPITTDKHKVLQILVNLVRNAKYACDESGRPEKQLVVGATRCEDHVRIFVSDNGVGIAGENLTRIFNHGFTTRKESWG